MRALVKFAALMAVGLFAAVLWLGFASGFDANGAALANGRYGFDMRSYVAGLAVGILTTTAFRFGLSSFVRRLAYWAVAFAPGFKLTTLALIFGGILVFY